MPWLSGADSLDGQKEGQQIVRLAMGNTVVQSFLSIRKNQNSHPCIESFELISVGSRAG